MNKEDKRVGDPDPGARCLFSNLKIGFDWQPGVEAHITGADFEIVPFVAGEWGMNLVSPASFEVWDNIP